MGDSPSPLVSAKDVTVRFGSTIALSRVTFELETGIAGLVGPNGAGKTTLLSALTGTLTPDAGECRLFGNSLASRRTRQRALRHVGYLPQTFDLAPRMSVYDTVAYAGWCNGLSARQLPAAVITALETVDLSRAPRRPVRTLSGGERQRLGLAAAAVHQPAILVLDEPTVGLDPEQRLQFRSRLRSLSSNTLVLLATHLLEDIDQAADRVLVLREGDLAFDGSVANLASMGDQADVPGASALERGYLSILGHRAA